ncbi:MAG: hypothetical protein AAF961_08205, partial [Planctomycetota bacterium]
GNFGGFVDCVTEESQSTMAGAMVMMGAMMKMMGGLAAMGGQDAVAKMEKQLAPINKVLEKHGVGDEALAKLQENGSPIGMMQSAQENPEAALGQLANAVENKRDFVADMLAVMATIDAGEGGPSQNLGEMAAKLSGDLNEVQIDEDSATAVIVSADGERTPISFRKSTDGWKAHLDLEEFGADQEKAEGQPQIDLGSAVDLGAQPDPGRIFEEAEASIDTELDGPQLDAAQGDGASDDSNE